MSTVPERRAVKTALRQAGLSSRQVDALLRHGWAGVIGATQAEADELREQLDALRGQFPIAPPSDVS